MAAERLREPGRERRKAMPSGEEQSPQGRETLSQGPAGSSKGDGSRFRKKGEGAKYQALC